MTILVTAKPLQLPFTEVGRYVYSLFTAIVKMSRLALILYDGLRLDKALRSPSEAAARSLRRGQRYARLRPSRLLASSPYDVNNSHVLLSYRQPEDELLVAKIP